MISEAELTEYLDTIASTGVLGKGERRLKLLKHLLHKEMAGEGASLKAYSIGIDALDKSDDFDPAIDSGVRVEMGRLRTALVQFEKRTDINCALAVDIPVGSYRPNIQRRIIAPTLSADDSPAPRSNSFAKIAAFVVAILACAALGAVLLQMRSSTQTGPGEFGVRVSMAPFAGDTELASQVETALRRSLVRGQTIAIFSQRTPGIGRADFSLYGLVNARGDETRRVSVELLNVHTNRIVWTKSIVVPNGVDLEEQTSLLLGDELRVQLLGASRNFLEGREPDRLTAQQLFLMATWIPGPTETNSFAWENGRIDLMQMALEKNPDLGTSHSVMADKLAQMANFYPAFDSATHREKALMHIQRATELDPLNPDVMFNIAQSHWHAGRIKQSQLTMQRVIDLDPGHNLARFLSDVIPYTCMPPPQEVIDNATLFDASLLADNPIRWITLTWIAWLNVNKGDYDAALAAKRQAALIFETPYSFMGHAMVLNEVGEPEAAADMLQKQRLNWPDISPDHFATATMPRLCAEAGSEPQLIINYETFAAAMAGRL